MTQKTPVPYLSIEAQMLKFCVVPLYFMHHACTLRKTFIPLPVTADTGSPTEIMRSWTLPLR